MRSREAWGWGVCVCVCVCVCTWGRGLLSWREVVRWRNTGASSER